VPYHCLHWVNISSFGGKKLMKNVHYFSHSFFTEKASEKLTVKLLQHFLACFKIFTLKTKKWWKIPSLSLMFSVDDFP
jgi:hypothetical protein